MAKKYYAVKKGRNTGIFTSWDECKKQVMGFSGAIYKSFTNVDDAKKYILNDIQLASRKSVTVQDSDTAVAYVDGSYNIKTKDFACGVIIFYHQKIYEFNEKFTDSTLSEMRNVAGEIKGAEMAIQFCLDNNITNINIFHDYEGIARWCDSSWKATKIGTKNYVDFYNNSKDKVNISFTKVKGHSGNKYNDRADRLAKDALGIK